MEENVAVGLRLLVEDGDRVQVSVQLREFVGEEEEDHVAVRVKVDRLTLHVGVQDVLRVWDGAGTPKLFPDPTRQQNREEIGGQDEPSKQGS